MSKVILVHGNGGTTIEQHWYPAVAAALREDGIEVVAETFPDNRVAHASVWLPYLQYLGADAGTVIVGHSSGAVAAMRYAEKHPLLGSVLIGACYTELGDEDEKASGYYDEVWNWEAIRANQQWIAQYASTDDPYIPIAEARYIHDKLETEYIEYQDRGHFMSEDFPELVALLLEKLA